MPPKKTTLCQNHDLRTADQACLDDWSAFMKTNHLLPLSSTSPRLVMKDGRLAIQLDEQRWIQVQWNKGTGIDQRHPLLSAIKTKPQEGCVLDATCGLGNDSFLLAAMGYQVIAAEKHPLMAILLQEAIWRTQDWLKDRFDMHLYQGDSIELMEAYPSNWPKPVSILIDPMLEQPSQALPKKSMQQLRQLVECEPEQNERLLAAALKLSQKKVIIKRPSKAKSLLNIKPSYSVYASLAGKGTRYDIYLV